MKTLTTDEFAGLFAVTTKTVNAWIAAGMPVKVRGVQGRGKRTQIELRAATEWFFAKNFERLELDRARTRLAHEQARKLKLENAQRSTELGERRVWDVEVARYLEGISSDLRRVPAMAPQIAGSIEQRRDVLETVVYGLLNRWSLS